jgi:hypothetical protein
MLAGLPGPQDRTAPSHKRSDPVIGVLDPQGRIGKVNFPPSF